MTSFKDKTVAIVSISLSGPAYIQDRKAHLGAACAHEFARHGAHVLAIDGDQAALDALRESITAEGGLITTQQADIADAEALRQAAARLEQSHARLHALVNAHSELQLGSIESSSDESWQRVVQANLFGPLFATRAFLPALKAAGEAAVVHIGSIDGILGNPRLPSYSVAKGGLVPMTHLMADEFASYGIRVNCVARSMFIGRDEPVSPNFAPLIAQTPMGRPAYADEVASVVRFLASPEASYVSGVVLPIDGGRTGVTPGTRKAPV